MRTHHNFYITERKSKKTKEFVWLLSIDFARGLCETRCVCDYHTIINILEIEQHQLIERRD